MQKYTFFFIRENDFNFFFSLYVYFMNYRNFVYCKYITNY